MTVIQMIFYKKVMKLTFRFEPNNDNMKIFQKQGYCEPKRFRKKDLSQTLMIISLPFSLEEKQILEV